MLRWSRWLVVMTSMLLLMACGKGEAPDPAKLAEDGAAAFEKVNSFHFNLDVTNGDSAPLGDTGIVLINADGDSVRPDKLKAKLKARLGEVPVAVNINSIIIGGQAWITPNPFNPNEFEKLEDTSGLDAFSPANGVSQVLRGLSDITYVGEEELDGVATYHIQATAEASTLNAITGGVASAGSLKVDLWLGKDDTLLRKLQAVGPLDPAEKPEITRTLTLSQFNEPITIDAPTS